MKKYCKAIVNLVVAFLILVAAIWLLPKALYFFSPFVIGWIIALIAGPLVRFFEEKIKIRRKVGSVVVIVVVIALVVLLIYSIITQLIEQVMGLVNALPGMWESMEADFNRIGEKLSVFWEKLPDDAQRSINDFLGAIGSWLGDFFGHIGTPTIAAAGNFAKQLPSIFIGLIMALLSSYFFVAEREQINEWFRRYTPATIQLRYRMVRSSLVKSVGGYFKAQLKIEIWMYFLLLIGLAVLHVDYYALIALGIAFMDFLPFFGTGTILIPWALIRILTAEYQVAVGLLIIWGAGQLARQLIQPKIVGDSMGVPPLPTLFLLYIGYKLGGVVGMIIAVPVGLLLYSMYEEGVFKTTRDSVMILVAGINRFRRLGKEDMSEVEEMEQRETEAAKDVARQREEALREREERRKARRRKK